jgi:hypothetical protein
MAFWNITAGTQNETFDSNGFPTGIDLDAGAIRALTSEGGSVSNDRFSNVALGEENPIITINSGVDEGGRGVVLAVPGTFNGGDQVIVKATTDIAGTANNVLLFGASDSADSPAINQAAQIEVRLYKTAIRNGEWNPVTAQFDTEPLTVAVSGGWDIAAGADDSADLIGNATDVAANPTQDEPGQLVYHYGSGAEPYPLRS